MANEEQLAILRQGVEVWNKSRDDSKFGNAFNRLTDGLDLFYKG